MTATPAPALTDAERETVDRFDAAPYPAEVAEAAVEQSVDLTPGVVWTHAQLEVVRHLVFRIHRAEEAVRRVEAVAEWCEKQAESRSHFTKVDPGYRDTVIPYEAAAERIRAALATQAGDVR